MFRRKRKKRKPKQKHPNSELLFACKLCRISKHYKLDYIWKLLDVWAYWWCFYLYHSLTRTIYISKKRLSSIFMENAIGDLLDNFFPSQWFSWFLLEKKSDQPNGNHSNSYEIYTIQIKWIFFQLYVDWDIRWNADVIYFQRNWTKQIINKHIQLY